MFVDLTGRLPGDTWTFESESGLSHNTIIHNNIAPRYGIGHNGLYKQKWLRFYIIVGL